MRPTDESSQLNDIRGGWRLQSVSCGFRVGVSADAARTSARATISVGLGLGVELDFDELLQDLEVDPSDSSAVDEQPGSSVHAQGPAFGYVFGHFGVGGFGFDTTAELHVVQAVLSGPFEDFGVEGIRRDLFLRVVHPVVEFPEGLCVLMEDAAAGDGGGSGPGVDGFERKILENNFNFVGVELRQKLAQGGRFGFARRTLQISELDDGHRRVGGTEARLTVGEELVEIGLKRILVDIEDRDVSGIALNHGLAV